MRIVESTIIVGGLISVLSVLTLRQQFAGADGDTFVVAGQTLVAFHDWTMAFVAASGALFQSPAQVLLTVPEMIWELIVKGFTAPERRRDVGMRPAPAAIPA